MNRKLLIAIVFVLTSLVANAQLCYYKYAETISENQGEITFNVYVFCDSEKDLSASAYLSGIRCVMFNGIPGTKFNKPLLPEGEMTLRQKNPMFFDDLYNIRYQDFVKECVMLSKFKKSGLEKSTLFQVTIRAFDLRKDLEMNKIKEGFGI